MDVLLDLFRFFGKSGTAMSCFLSSSQVTCCKSVISEVQGCPVSGTKNQTTPLAYFNTAVSNRSPGLKSPSQTESARDHCFLFHFKIHCALLNSRRIKTSQNVFCFILLEESHTNAQLSFQISAFVLLGIMSYFTFCPCQVYLCRILYLTLSLNWTISQGQSHGHCQNFTTPNNLRTNQG